MFPNGIDYLERTFDCFDESPTTFVIGLNFPLVKRDVAPLGIEWKPIIHKGAPSTWNFLVLSAPFYSPGVLLLRLDSAIHLGDSYSPFEENKPNFRARSCIHENRFRTEISDGEEFRETRLRTRFVRVSRFAEGRGFENRIKNETRAFARPLFSRLSRPVPLSRIKL